MTQIYRMKTNQVLSCILVTMMSQTYGMKKCTPVGQYYEEASDSCAPCSQLCHLHQIQGTTQRCKEKCWKYFQATSIPPAPTSPLPTQTSTQASDAMSTEIRIVLIVVLVVVGISVVAIVFALWSKLKRCRRCPPAPKPPGPPTDPPDPPQPPRYPQECTPTQAVQPQSDPGDRSALYMSPLQTGSEKQADETQGNQAGEEDGEGETTRMLPAEPRAGFRVEDETQ